MIRRLPAQEAEITVLYYLQGYDCGEIARIVGAPVSTVKYRLLMARSRLQRELGEGDLAYLNELATPMRQWAWLPLDQMHALESRLTRGIAGDREEEAQVFPMKLGLAFVYIPGAKNQHPIYVQVAEGGASGQCHYRQR